MLLRQSFPLARNNVLRNERHWVKGLIQAKTILTIWLLEHRYGERQV